MRQPCFIPIRFDLHLKLGKSNATFWHRTLSRFFLPFLPIFFKCGMVKLSATYVIVSVYIFLSFYEWVMNFATISVIRITKKNNNVILKTGHCQKIVAQR